MSPPLRQALAFYIGRTNRVMVVDENDGKLLGEVMGIKGAHGTAIALSSGHGFATSGWNAAPTAAKIIARVAPMLGLEPRLDLPPADQLILANMKQAAR